MDRWDGKPGQLFDIASTAAAWIALGLAYLSNRTGKKALRLAQIDSERKIPRLVPYLVDSVAHAAESNERTIELAISLSNPSDTANSVARAELAIAHIAGDLAVVNVLVPAERESEMSSPRLLNVPFGVDAHCTVAGTLQFRVPTALVKPVDIRNQALQLTDSHGNIVSLDVRVIKEISRGIP
jgi:hypothetical protein